MEKTKDSPSYHLPLHISPILESTSELGQAGTKPRVAQRREIQMPLLRLKGWI